jgi:sigma-B regulation protein RsbU (phosphoserine phosphatase)
MMRVQGLQQRLMFFLLLPVAALLIGEGVFGFFYARRSLLMQWREAAVLKLQRAAHDVDMRLNRPKNLLEMYSKTAGKYHDERTQKWILEQLRLLEGVERVGVVREAGETSENMPQMHRGHHRGQAPRQEMMGEGGGMMHFHRARIAKVSPPRYDSLSEHDTVSIDSELLDEKGQAIGELEVVIGFDYLLENLGATGWWQSTRAFLVDSAGRILACTDPHRRQLGENNDPLELATLKAMEEEPSGTILGPGRPAKEVSGFYRLGEADWSLVMVAPGDQILAPIIRFRNYYILTGSFFILFVLLLIRLVTGRTVSSIKDVSTAAEKIAQGKYSSLPPARTQDEVGQLITNFNTMVSQLQERMKMKEALGLAMEVQQGLLPRKSPEIKGLDVAARSIYCDETGGDYYDFIAFPKLGNGRVGIAVGDVAGHGIAPALIMTTVRALLRSRAMQPGSLSQMITDVNRLLCTDTSDSGNFMTLFFMLIDEENQELKWVRAGHEPAILYDFQADSFSELHGNGIALGVDSTWLYEEYEHEAPTNGQIILIGTDGIWETENPQGEMFGKQRLREIIHRRRNHTSHEIVQAILDALSDYRQSAPQKDDITMVVMKQF